MGQPQPASAHIEAVGKRISGQGVVHPDIRTAASPRSTECPDYRLPKRPGGNDASGASTREWYSRPGAPWASWGPHACMRTDDLHVGRSSTRPGATTEQDKALLLRPGGQGLAMIIVSGPSAKATQRVRTGRSHRHVANQPSHRSARRGFRIVKAVVVPLERPRDQVEACSAVQRSGSLACS
jgi:hypothetical protein